MNHSLLSYIQKVKPINDVDPLKYYVHPVVGVLFRRRIEMGLELLGDKYQRLLEIGYGSGFLLPYLAEKGREVFGLDLEADPQSVANHLSSVTDTKFTLKKGDALRAPFQDGLFDCVVAFSIYEHIVDVDQALSELLRITAPGASILIGMPSVNRFMELGFRAIGFKNIDDHHVTTPQKFLKEAKKLFVLKNQKTLPFNVPMSMGLYHAFLFERTPGE